MEKYQEVEGDLIKLALKGNFDVIVHGCNCFCTMKAGIAPLMAKTFGCDKFNLELTEKIKWDPETEKEYKIPTNNKGNINKLGNIDFSQLYLWFKHPAIKEEGVAYPMHHKSKDQPDVKDLIVVNAYTQYQYGRNHLDGIENPLDYEALTLCLRKINFIFKGKHIGLPLIGCGLAGGIWDYTKIPNDHTHKYYIMRADYATGVRKDVKTIIQQELKDCFVTVVKFLK